MSDYTCMEHRIGGPTPGVLVCPCGNKIEVDDIDFGNSEVGCEDCGEHPALYCGACGEYTDLIYSHLEHIHIRNYKKEDIR